MNRFCDELQPTFGKGSSREVPEFGNQTLPMAQSEFSDPEALLQRHREWQQERSKLVQALIRRDVELAELRNAMQASIKTARDLDAQIKLHVKEIAYLTKRTIEAEAQVEQIFASASWKFTAPARKIMCLLRGKSH
jgi:vacuolar-type H+-ATPase subunit I/STV1